MRAATVELSLVVMDLDDCNTTISSFTGSAGTVRDLIDIQGSDSVL